MARAKSLIRIAADLMHSPQGGPAKPADIIARVNRELCRDNNDMMFVTLFFAMLAPGSGEVEYCNAGHNAPYRLSGDRVETIEGAKGIILGVRPEASYTTGRLSLAAGESIYVFTDGVTEAENSQQDMFSEERLEATLRAAAGRTSAEIVRTVAEAVSGFVGTALASDDITMMAIRRLAPPGT
jgi:sigma-B regulation protein RsbU (phosphoserine phosphatase)